MKKINTYTLGCKVNKYDTEAMIKLFVENGYEEVGDDEYADVFVINTCSVTNLSEKKSRQLIRKVKNNNPDAIVVAMGCYAQVSPKEVSKIEGVNLIIGTKNRSEIVNLCENYSPSMGIVNTVSDIMEEKDFEPLNVNEFKNMTRAFLKIQEGCNQYCSYCIIPFARGNIRSRKPLEVIEEVKKLATNGVKEVVLAGIHVASYGKDLKNITLLELIQQVHEIDGIERIRFSSVEPNLMNEKFVSSLAELPKVCDHFHLSLQSGSDTTLKNMNRKYTAKEYKNSVDIIRKYYKNPSLTTDVIVGFPNESEQDFIDSYNFCKEIGFAKIHVFPYSPKKGTKAFDMDGHLQNKVKDERAKKLRELSNKMQIEYNKQFLEKNLDILVEKNQVAYYTGHSTNYINVKIRTDKNIEENTIVNCKIMDIDGENAICVL